MEEVRTTQQAQEIEFFGLLFFFQYSKLAFCDQNSDFGSF